MITRENYEIYFMEYMDGNLSARGTGRGGGILAGSP